MLPSPPPPDPASGVRAGPTTGPASPDTTSIEPAVTAETTNEEAREAEGGASRDKETQNETAKPEPTASAVSDSEQATQPSEHSPEAPAPSPAASATPSSAPVRVNTATSSVTLRPASFAPASSGPSSSLPASSNAPSPADLGSVHSPESQNSLPPPVPPSPSSSSLPSSTSSVPASSPLPTASSQTVISDAELPVSAHAQPSVGAGATPGNDATLIFPHFPGRPQAAHLSSTPYMGRAPSQLPSALPHQPLTHSERLPVVSVVKRPAARTQVKGILKHPPPAPPSINAAVSPSTLLGNLGGLGNSALGSSISSFLTGKPGQALSMNGIIQNINTKLAQGGMNVQVPLGRGGDMFAQPSTQRSASAPGSGAASGLGAITGPGADTTSSTGPGLASRSEQGAGSMLAEFGSSQPPAAGIGSMLKRWVPQPVTSQAPASDPSLGDRHSANAPLARDVGESFMSQPFQHTSASSTIESSAPSTAQGSSSTLIGTDPTPSLEKSAMNRACLPPARTEDVPIKKVQFRMADMALSYPIWGSRTPASEDVTRRRVEAAHRARLKARNSGDPVGRSSPNAPNATDATKLAPVTPNPEERKAGAGTVTSDQSQSLPLYTVSELEHLYRKCCRAREELPLKRLRIVFEDAARVAEEKRRSKINVAIVAEKAKLDEERERVRVRVEKGKAVVSSPTKNSHEDDLARSSSSSSAPSSTRQSEDFLDASALISAVEARFPPSSLTATLTTLDLSFLILDRPAIDPLADFLSVDFGLKKLVLDHCGLTDDGLKAILHALLISGTLPHLSLAANKGVRYIGWRYLSGFLRRAQKLVSLDISENNLTRPALESILASFVRSQSELEALSLHHASHRAQHELKPHIANEHAVSSTPDAAQAPKEQNRQATSAATDEASEASEASKGKGRELSNNHSMPESYKSATLEPNNEPTEEVDEDGEPLFPAAPLLRPNLDSNGLPPVSNLQSLRLENCNLRSSSMLEVVAKSIRFSTLRHLSLRRNRIGHSSTTGMALALLLRDFPDESAAAADEAARIIDLVHKVSLSGNGPGTPGFAAVAAMVPLKPIEQPVPLPPLAGPTVGVTLPVGNVGSRLENALKRSAMGSDTNNSTVAPGSSNAAEAKPTRETETLSPDASAALQERLFSEAKRARRVLGDLPRFGCLLTLDLKSNDLRFPGALALAGALKKNRTLKVLNLSDNGLDVPALVALAEGLRGNTVLETLDMSHNACGGPGLDGIHALRQVFALRTGLKRLFLNDTDVSSQGAIALAEFVPDAKSLLHLDLTENYEIDLAGAMALSVALRLNRSIRCLDLHIPPNEPDCARLSQDIFNSCVRNTQAAQERARVKGAQHTIPSPIYKSILARQAQRATGGAVATGTATNSPSSTTKTAIGLDSQSSDSVAANSGAYPLSRPALERTSSGGASREAARELIRTVQQDTGVDGRRKVDMDTLLEAATQCRDLLSQFRDRQSRRVPSTFSASSEASSSSGAVSSEEDEETWRVMGDVVRQAARVRVRLAQAVDGMEEGRLLERVLGLSDQLEELTLDLRSIRHRNKHLSAQPKASAQMQSSIESGGQPRITGDVRHHGASKDPSMVKDTEVLTPKLNTISPHLNDIRREQNHLLGATSLDLSSSASPTFSIGSDEDDNEPLENLVPRPVPARRVTSDEPLGLGLDLQGPESGAAREEVELEEGLGERLEEGLEEGLEEEGPQLRERHGPEADLADGDVEETDDPVIDAQNPSALGEAFGTSALAAQAKLRNGLTVSTAALSPPRSSSHMPSVPSSPRTHSPTESRAKDQIVEEGAMFRRAKMLEAVAAQEEKDQSVGPPPPEGKGEGAESEEAPIRPDALAS